ncbi:cadherin-related tumor suppressor-like [Lineus longissimus]|uniref:cadherin-related tumor suppressor-like n=1 Tax=Lineus longissimus TaxID=88925 RepID=UPI00315D843F
MRRVQYLGPGTSEDQGCTFLTPRTKNVIFPMRTCSKLLLQLTLLLFLFTFARGQGPGTNLEGAARFADERVNFTIYENQPPGTVVGFIPIKSGFTYKFNQQPKEFTLDPNTGELSTNMTLDREGLSSDRINLLVLSSHPVYPIEVYITVKDLNDNAPVFPHRSVEVKFPETALVGAWNILDMAVDADIGDNGTVDTYKIISGNDDGKFAIQLSANDTNPLLFIKIKKKLDHEEKDSYQLNISAQDKGTPPRFGYLQINISVTDINDNPPKFDLSFYTARVNESAPIGTTVIQVRATDLDTGIKSDIIYSADDESMFTIDSLTGVITTTLKLDCPKSCKEALTDCNEYEKISTCVINVQAKDVDRSGNSGSLVGRARVSVTLDDENDHSPVIKFQYAGGLDVAAVDESAQDGDIAAFVTVTDSDAGTNAETMLQLTAGNELGHFRLDKLVMTHYVVKVAGRNLDREKINKYNLTLVATDKGTPPRSSTAFLIVRVNDVNDHAPEFQKTSYHVELSELVQIGSFVVGITATDNDTDFNEQCQCKLRYAIVSGNDLGWFQIDKDTGLVSTKTLLDREQRSLVNLNISAMDYGSRPHISFTRLAINIFDENDMVPTFSQITFNIAKTEGLPAGTEILTATAVDNDGGVNGTVVYSLLPEVNHNYPKTFSLDSKTGRLTTRMTLDREVVPFYVVKIKAQDGGTPSLSSTTTVYLNVTDINDNPPIFYPRNYFATVMENKPSGTTVVQVTATDLDAGENGRILYSIVDGGEGKFTISSSTGWLTTTATLNKQQKSKYTINLSAKDPGNLVAPAPAIVEVSVIDKLAVSPVFSQSSYVFLVDEDSDDKTPNIGTKIGKVTASNPQTSASIVYAISSGDPDQIFRIDAASGNLFTNRKVDREKHQKFSLKVIAKAGSMFGTTMVNITVKDKNDNSPEFGLLSVDAVVMENWPVGHEVYHAQAIDKDQGPNALVKYTLIQDPDNAFGIDPDTGIIFLNKPIIIETKKSFQLQVSAVDSGTPPKSSTMQVRLTVQDVNDHTPTFTQDKYEIAISESLEVNTRFYAVSARDADDGPNADVAYSIIKGNVNNKFGIFPDGFLYVAQRLDRENRDTYKLVLKAADRGTPPRSSTSSIIIQILDANDNKPKFSNSSYTMYLFENAASGTSVGTVSATDRDIGRNQEIMYLLEKGMNDFEINPSTGLIISEKVFDREEMLRIKGQDFVEFTVIAMDHGSVRQQEQATVKVIIQDRNDNTPRFTQQLYEDSLYENANLETQIIKVYADDIDSGPNGYIFYTITSGNEDNKFHINQGSGQIKLVGKLDRETKDSYELVVTAQDKAPVNPLSATATVRIKVLDYNDNTPVFGPSQLLADLPETTSPGELITTFSATDQDFGSNALVSYGISSGNQVGTFNLDANTGRLYLAKKVDYEATPKFFLNITATDYGNPRLSSTISFTVNVIDYNDNPPVFPSDPIGRQIQEGIRPDTSIVQVLATDPDSGPNGQVRYSLIQEVGNYFKIDAVTGWIKTNAAIDREKEDNFVLKVIAVDQALPATLRKSAEKMVNIIVMDSNDNAPEFISMDACVMPYGAVAGSKVTTIQAIDADTGRNANVSYALTSGDSNTFTLNGETGDLYLRISVPQSKLTYELNIAARDQGMSDQLGRKSTNSKFTVIIPGDGGPTFSKSRYDATVTENTPADRSVVTVSASYPGSNGGLIQYFITSITSGGIKQPRYFKVNPTNGIISTAEVLDRETGFEDFLVEVVAVDKRVGTPKTTKVEVHISLSDQNDSPPLFTSPSYQVTVPENSQGDQTLAIISARDADKDQTITFRILSGNDGKFQLDSASGVLTTTGGLDREQVASYNLVVEASDGVHKSTAIVYVNVKDVNDNAPTFSKPSYSFDIPENTPKGTTVSAVTASDDDAAENGEITFSYATSYGQEVFALDSKTGIITVNGFLNYEQTPHYILKVKATDGGNPALSSTVTVYMNVIDRNDNSPIFDPVTSKVEILENVTTGKSIVTVRATDVDAGKNGELQYSIESGDNKAQFRINSKNGTIFTTKPLDREEQAIYTLVVKATDQAEDTRDRLSSTTQVTIILRDINDCAPEFKSPNETEVTENTPLNTIVYTVIAEDKDAESNKYITYKLVTVPFNAFSLEPLSGKLRVNGPLDREKITSYRLVIQATDQGSPAKSSTMVLMVMIKDENDNDPQFIPSDLNAKVIENEVIGTSVLKLTATDLDIGLNSMVRYFITAGDPNQDFKIDEYTGILRVNKKLDYERISKYQLTVQAEDSGRDTRYDTTQVSIRILDINDCSPVFVDAPYTAFVRENMKNVPVYVTLVTARDDDSQFNSVLTYAIRRGNSSVFEIDSSTGEIKAKIALDREEISSYSLTIVAHDSGIPRLSGTVTVSVYVNDVNDHDPVFERSAYTGYIAENIPPSVSITAVQASDKDEGLNAQIRYHLLDSMGDRFTVNPASGLILTTASLDREHQDHYKLIVVASDSGSTPRSSTASVTIYIEDKNDHAPEFEHRAYTGYIPDQTKPGDFVIGLTAVDQDIGPNCQIVYALSGGDSSKFTINRDNGVVTAKDLLTMSSKPQGYKFTVSATDKGTPSMANTSMVDIKFTTATASSTPIFATGQRTFDLSESKQVGQTVMTALATSPISADPISYDIIGGNIGETFEVGIRSGQVKIALGLDYEITHSYSLWIRALDSRNPPGSSLMSITVNIEDENDNPPKFDQSFYNTTIMEELPSGQGLLTVTAKDADSGVNKNILFSIISGNTGTAFKIGADTGEIKTAIRLNREILDHYSLIVKAADQGQPQKTATATVLVNVEDKNDNPPQFTKLFNVAIPENSPKGTFVIRITSSDKDIGQNAVAIYSFRQSSTKFTIDGSSGNVTVIGDLDRETEDEYILTIDATDGSWKISTTLSILVTDVNDHTPVFSKQDYTFYFEELQPQVALVGAVHANDSDAPGVNSDIVFSMKQDDPNFRIDPNNGQIFSKKSVKYLQDNTGPSPKNQHAFILVASDKGNPSRSTEATCTVVVIDANNNAPIFQKDKYVSAVPENANIGKTVLQLVAEDKLDYGINAEVEYSLGSGNGSDYVRVDSSTGWVTIAKSLSGEKNKDFTFVVTAKDKGTPIKFSQTMVRLRVTGVNYYSPRFTTTNFQVTINEDSRVGHIIAVVKAEDDDTDDMNGRVEYFITSGNEKGLFNMNQNSGMLTIKAPLDYDTTPVHRLTIVARDQGLISRQVSRVFTVYLEDVNDSPPTFNHTKYDAYIAENSPTGTTVITMKAYDADSGANAIIEYSIVGDRDAQKVFSIHTSSGELVTQVAANQLDYETRNRYQATVIASNPNSKMESTVVVNIHVTSVNEYMPKFLQKEYNYIVSESATVGTSVGKVFASDQDTGEDGIIYYYLVSESNNKGFRIDPMTGNIYVTKAPDRESQATVILDVMAKNRGPLRGNDADHCIVRLGVQDANDAPVFSKDVYEANITENAQSGSRVIVVSAVDNDLKPEHRQFSFIILNNNRGGVFRINSQTGEVTVAGRLDRETVSIYNVTVGAVDTGVPPQTGSATVKITIEDFNDNGPVFIPPQPFGYLTEEETPPSNIMVLTSVTSDPDLPPNQGPYQYSIPSSSPLASKFKVDSNSGILTALVRLDREAQPDYLVPVVVKDGGTPQMSSTLTVRVIMRDINDSPSLPRPLNILVFCYQTQYPVGKIADVQPVDPDSVGTYTCRKTQGSDLFSIPSACDLHAKKITQGNKFSLKVSGSDSIHAEVSYDISLTYHQIDNNTLGNTIIVQLENIITENFLQNSYVNFMKAVGEMFTKIDQVLLFGINEAGSHLNLLIAVKKQDGKYVYVSNLETLFKTNQAQIESEAGVRFKVINLNPCADNPCMNEGECSSAIDVYTDTTISSSQSLVITTPDNNGGFTCTCRNGFSGPYCNISDNNCQNNPCNNGGQCHTLPDGTDKCDCLSGWEGAVCSVDINECQRNRPCRNGGACSNKPGSYECSCKQGYSGDNCEVKIDYCKGTVCQNGGTCHSKISTYECECPFGNAGRNCEHTSVGFDELSYMEFNMLKATDNTIVLEFATVMPNALLLYNVGDKLADIKKEEFLALEIINGKIRFSYALGDPTTTRIWVQKTVNNGKWHRVEATRQRQQGFISVSECPEDSLSCNQCQDSSCQNSSSSATFSSLSVKNPLTIGGVRNLQMILNHMHQVETYDFVGCIRNITIDGNDLLAATPLATNFTTSTCPRSKQGVCKNDTCGEKGKCKDVWGTARCECPAGKMPPDCKSAIEPFSFGANARVIYTPKESYKRAKQFEAAKANARRKRTVSEMAEKVSFRIRTRDDNGLLFYVASGIDYTVIMVSDGLVQYGFWNKGIGGSLTVAEVKVTDGNWHNVTLSTAGGREVTLEVDKKIQAKTFTSSVHSFLGLDITAMSVGGASAVVKWDQQELKSFNGCLSDFKLNDKIQPFSGATDRFTVEAVGGVAKSCPGPSVCIPNPCPVGNKCEIVGGVSQCIPRVAASTLNIGIILVIVFFIVLVIAIIISVVIIQRRRMNKDVPKVNGSVIVMGNKHGNDSGHSNHSYQDSGYTENGEIISDAFIRNHIAEELATMKFNERNVDSPHSHARPDIIEAEKMGRRMNAPSPVRMDDGTVIIENGDAMGFEESPELYDLENASSIAPPDIDVVKHYKKYRKYSGNPNLPYLPSHLRNSPNMLNMSRDSPVSVSRQSPNILAESPSILKMQSTPLNRQSPLNMPGGQSPIQMQGYTTPVRQSPLGHLSRQSPKSIGASPLTLPMPSTQIRESRSNSEQSLPHPVGRSNHSNSSQSLTSRDPRARTPNRLPNGHPPRPSSRANNRPAKTKSGHVKGLTVDEINRLNARPLMATPPSTIDADQSSTDFGPPPRYKDIFEPTGLLEPPESSSDDVSDDDFTCSEFEYDNHEKIRSEFDTNIMIFPKVQEEDENEESPMESNRTFSGDESARGSLSTLLVSDEDAPKHVHQHKNLGGAFNWDYLLNWGPSFEKLVGVFQDIAELPDANAIPHQEAINDSTNKHEEYV